ncbi:hypothetical protein PV327_002275 [Microctonus hyperodae]|uniref:Odorant receptor n=1 Tax=Microctonus hyperodae TaxID=165561 RepID=A0AA39FFB5_MICHY|nr:hypothetical protein PV327_002275 [Microctonus hyperodae]
MVMSSNKSSITKKSPNKFVNVSSDIDAQFALQVNRWLFKPLGIWPLKQDSPVIEKLVASSLRIMGLFLLAFRLVPGIHLLIKVKKLSASVKITGPLNHGMMALLKYQSLIFGQHHLIDCIQEIFADWRELNSMNDRNIMIKNAKRGRFGTTVCIFFTYGGGIFYTIIFPQLRGINVNANNETMRPLAYPGYYGLFDSQKSPAYEIVFLLQSWGGYVGHTITCATCSLAIVFGMHACGQLEIITSWLRELVSEKKAQEDSNELFSMIINKHVKTLRFINKIENLISRVCLVEVVGCTLNMCLVGYNLMTCKKVGETTYMIDWYRLPERNALALTLTIVTAQKPIIMSAGKFVDLSLSSFSSVMRTAIAYLNLLRTFMD